MDTILWKLLCFSCFLSFVSGMSEETKKDRLKYPICPVSFEGCCPTADSFTYKLNKLFGRFEKYCIDEAKNMSAIIGNDHYEHYITVCKFSCYFKELGWIDEEGYLIEDAIKNDILSILPPVPEMHDVIEDKFQYFLKLTDKMNEHQNSPEKKQCPFYCFVFTKYIIMPFIYSRCPESQRTHSNDCDTYFDELKTCLNGL